eukprot:2681316-Pyramimonas_sp.AAC.1
MVLQPFSSSSFSISKSSTTSHARPFRPCMTSKPTVLSCSLPRARAAKVSTFRLKVSYPSIEPSNSGARPRNPEESC